MPGDKKVNPNINILCNIGHTFATEICFDIEKTFFINLY